MSKTLQQNRFLHDGKPFSQFLILDIEFIEGTQNSIPDLLTHEFSQNSTQDIQKKASIAAPTPKAT